MRFLPIVERELRVASRRRSVYWIRAAVALGAMVGMGWLFLLMQREPPREQGQIIFYVLTGAALAYCWLAGMRATVDCLSEEKRDGTLGLLFLTDLKGYDVVLGKLAAGSLNTFYGVMAVVPVLGIPLLLGGVTAGEFGRVAAVLVNTLFFSLCVGMFASSLSKEVFRAMTVAFVVLFVVTCGLPLIGAWLDSLGVPRNECKYFYLPCPGVGFAFALDTLFRREPETYYRSLGAIHAFAWFFLGLAFLITPHAWQDRPLGSRGARWRENWSRISHGDLVERRRFRETMLQRNPFYWLASRPRFKPATVWGVLGLTALIWGWGISKEGHSWVTAEVFTITAIALNSFLKGWIALEACRQLADDHRSGALELLLSTPLSVPEILKGQRLALQRQFASPIIVVLCWELWMLGYPFPYMGDDRKEFVMMWLVGIAIFVADAIALCWLGMWMGLVKQNARRAFNACMLRIIALPWIAFALSLMWIAGADIEPVLAVGFLLSLIFDIGFGVSARQKLLTEFRLVATQRFQPRPSLFQLIFGDSTRSGSKPGT